MGSRTLLKYGATLPLPLRVVQLRRLPPLQLVAAEAGDDLLDVPRLTPSAPEAHERCEHGPPRTIDSCLTAIDSH